MKYFGLAALFMLLAAGGTLGGWYFARPGARTGRTAGARLFLYGRAPSFALTNQLGKPVNSASLAGKVRVVTFLFPYCTEYCPYIAKWMVRTEKVLVRKGLSDRVQLVSFDVDPGHTTPKVLRAFMRQYGWTPQDTHWQYLTGSPQAIRRIVTDGYHISYERVDATPGKADGVGSDSSPHGGNPLAEKVRPGYDVEHNDDVVIVDRKGRIRAVIARAYRLTPEQVIALIRRVWNSP